MVVKKNSKVSYDKLENSIIKKGCNDYKYLGVTITSSSSYSAYVDIIKQKVQKSYFDILSKSNKWDGFNPRMFLFLLSTIFPIKKMPLKYGNLVQGYVWKTLQFKILQWLRIQPKVLKVLQLLS